MGRGHQPGCGYPGTTRASSRDDFRIPTPTRALFDPWRVTAQIAKRIQSAFRDLDTVSALALMRGLEADPDVPAGAKFETFLYADRILGLDLPRDIGRA
jgi:hypothetical protein